MHLKHGPRSVNAKQMYRYSVLVMKLTVNGLQIPLHIKGVYGNERVAVHEESDSK